jgi:hypothetical protein
MIFTLQETAPCLSDLQEAEVERIKQGLKPGQSLSSILVPCVGRPDYGHQFVDKLKAAGVSAF